jgi:hypothetical protein
VEYVQKIIITIFRGPPYIWAPKSYFPFMKIKIFHFLYWLETRKPRVLSEDNIVFNSQYNDTTHANFYFNFSSSK